MENSILPSGNGNSNDVTVYKAWYTLATKLNSTRSTLLKVDKVDPVALALYTLAT